MRDSFIFKHRTSAIHEIQRDEDLIFVFIVYVDVDYCVYKLYGSSAHLEASSRSAGQYIDVDYCVYKLNVSSAPWEASIRSAGQDIFCLLESEISSFYSLNPAN